MSKVPVEVECFNFDFLQELTEDRHSVVDSDDLDSNCLLVNEDQVDYLAERPLLQFCYQGLALFLEFLVVFLWRRFSCLNFFSLRLLDLGLNTFQ